MKTVSQILQDSAAYLDLDPAVPTGTELSVRLNYIKQALNEWAAAYNWKQLNQVYSPSATTMASLPLPSNFRNLIGAPRNMTGDSTWEEYPEILPQERYLKDADEKYCYILGDPAAGYVAVFNNLASNASISIDYQRYPSNVATLTDSVEADDGEYIKTKVISYVLQSRSDDRFPIVEADASRMLRNMIGRANNRTPGGTGQTPKRGSSAYSLGRGR